MKNLLTSKKIKALPIAVSTHGQCLYKTTLAKADILCHHK